MARRTRWVIGATILLGTAASGCVTTDVGNPVDAEVSFTGYEETRVNALTLDSGITITRALISVERIALVEGAGCNVVASEFAPRVTVDLLEAGDSVALPPFTNTANEFCGVSMNLAPAPMPGESTDDMVSMRESEMAGISLLVDGTRADGTPFEVRAALEDPLQLDAIGRSFELHGSEKLVVGFALNEWLGTTLDGIDAPTEGPISLDAIGTTEMTRLRIGVTGSSRLFRDLDADGELDSLEITEPLAVGKALDLDLPDDEVDGDVAVEENLACMLMRDAEVIELTAVADVDDDPPHAAFEGTRVEVSLVDVEGGRGGLVRIPRDNGDEWELALSDDVPTRIIDENGDEVVAEVDDSTSCDEVAYELEIDTEPGGYFLEIGPTTLETVSLVYDD